MNTRVCSTTRIHKETLEYANKTPPQIPKLEITGSYFKGLCVLALISNGNSIGGNYSTRQRV